MSTGETVRVLVVDDEDSIRKRCVRLLARQGYDAVGASDSLSALQLLGESAFDLVLADIRMPGMDGMDLLGKIKQSAPSVEVILMTGYAAVEAAVKAMKAGALDYLAKPFDVEELLHAVRRVAEKKSMQREIADLRRQLQGQRGPTSLIGVSPPMAEVMRFVRKVASVDSNVLILGESGTGKELVARAIHESSQRAQRPFVIADCAALSGSILGSELFGHVKGAFTGALSERKGYFESAEGGTLFLDEIGELPLDVQGKLLRAVQEQVIVKVGATRPAKVDVRIIAATNRDLRERVSRGAFREDLYYRLNVVHVTVPALRDRREDIPLLVSFFLRRVAAQLDLPVTPRLPPEDLPLLVEYDWPGNVRELENAVHRALVMAEGEVVRAGDILPAHGSASPAKAQPGFRDARRRAAEGFTAEYLGRCLRQFQGNVTHAAKFLGMRRTSLQRLLRKVGLDAASFRKEAPPK